MALWKYSKEWTTWAKRVFSKRYTFLCYRASQSRGLTRRPPFTTCVTPTVIPLVISIYLNSVCYLISFTRLFTKLNLFEILLYVIFITTKVSRSTVFMLSITSLHHSRKWPRGTHNKTTELNTHRLLAKHLVWNFMYTQHNIHYKSQRTQWICIHI